MNEQKPVIDPHTKDYGVGQGKNFKIAIILTILLITVICLMVYSINKKIGKVGDVNDPVEITSPTTAGTIAVDPASYIKHSVTETDSLLIIEATNTSDSTYDISLRLNLYVNNEINNTVSDEMTDVKSLDKTIFIVDKSKLGIYDKYEILFNVSRSIYESMVVNELNLVEDSALVDNKLYYLIENTTGKKIDKVTVVVLFYDNAGKVIDAKKNSVFVVGDKDSIVVDDSSLEYATATSFIVEAYTI